MDQAFVLLVLNLDPPRPWQLTTNLPVFSLALVLGDPGDRRWLVYAHAPRAARQRVTLTIPAFRDITIDVSRAGTFVLVDERQQTVAPVDVDPSRQ